jgi:hypothetical protein
VLTEGSGQEVEDLTPGDQSGNTHLHYSQSGSKVCGCEGRLLLFKLSSDHQCVVIHQIELIEEEGVGLVEISHPQVLVIGQERVDHAARPARDMPGISFQTRSG